MFDIVRPMTRMIAIGAFVILGAEPTRGQQEESSIECDEGNEPLLIEYGQHTSNCDLFIPTDFDRFRFRGDAGDLVRIVVRGNTNDLDPRVELLDPEGNPILDESCNANCCNPCTLDFELVLESSGLHTILLSDAGTNNAGAYTLQIEKILPDDLPPAIAYDSTIADTLAPSTDTDFWTFEAEEGTRFRIIVRGTRNDLDPRIRLMNENGESILEDSDPDRCSANCCNPCSFTLEKTIPATGLYYIMIDEWGSDNTGGYEISLQCLSGNCCPVPANLNGDCCLDSEDFFLYLDAFAGGDLGVCDCDEDGDCDADDFFCFLDQFAQGCP